MCLHHTFQRPNNIIIIPSYTLLDNFCMARDPLHPALPSSLLTFHATPRHPVIKSLISYFLFLNILCLIQEQNVRIFIGDFLSVNARRIFCAVSLRMAMCISYLLFLIFHVTQTYFNFFSSHLNCHTNEFKLPCKWS